MGKKATKAADNIYCTARYEAAQGNEVFSSREGAAEFMKIDRTRLARIELGKLRPYPEEILAMAQAYHAPELCNAYCVKECPLGKDTVNELTLDDLDRLMLKVLGSLKGIEALRTKLITIAEDGVITENERPEFNEVLKELEEVAINAQTLQLWAKKNIGRINGK